MVVKSTDRKALDPISHELNGMSPIKSFLSNVSDEAGDDATKFLMLYLPILILFLFDILSYDRDLQVNPGLMPRVQIISRMLAKIILLDLSRYFVLCE